MYAAKRWGSRGWVGNLTCIFKTHADTGVHLNKPQAHRKHRYFRNSRRRASPSAHMLCVYDEVVRVRASQSNLIKCMIVIILWTFNKHCLNAHFKVVSASHTGCLISLFSFSSNSLNMAEMTKKELMGEIMELTHNLSIYQCVLEAHTHTQNTRTHLCSKTHIHLFIYNTCIAHKTDAHIHKAEIRIEWIMKLLLTLSTYDPLSITQMDTTLSYWSLPLLFHFLVSLVVFHLVTSPLICIADGFHGRWWDYKSEVKPSDYHHGDQLSTHSSTLKSQNVSAGNDTHHVRHAQWVSNGQVSSSSSVLFVSRW